MTREEIRKECDRLGTEICHEYDPSAELHYRDGFKAATELMERERVQPLIEGLKELCDATRTVQRTVKPTDTLVTIHEFARITLLKIGEVT